MSEVDWQEQYFRDGKFYPPKKHPATGEPDMCEWDEFMDVVQDHPEEARAAGLPEGWLGNGAFWYGDEPPEIVPYPNFVQRLSGCIVGWFLGW